MKQATKKALVLVTGGHFAHNDKCTHIIGNGEFMSTGLVTGIQTCC